MTLSCVGNSTRSFSVRTACTSTKQGTSFSAKDNLDTLSHGEFDRWAAQQCHGFAPLRAIEFSHLSQLRIPLSTFDEKEAG
jgi:hypothetical protein